jgi:hypothetical protein
MSFLKGAFYGAIAGFASFLVLFWVVVSLPISFSCTAYSYNSWSFDAAFLAVPVFFLWFGVAIGVYDILSRRPLLSSTTDGLVIGFAAVLDVLAFLALPEFLSIPPPV